MEKHSTIASILSTALPYREAEEAAEQFYGNLQGSPGCSCQLYDLAIPLHLISDHASLVPSQIDRISAALQQHGARLVR